MAGRLYGVGVGPGDPELLTLKALRLVRSAPVVAYPVTEEGDSVARSIVASWLEARQREIRIRIPMRPGSHPTEKYDAAASALAVELDRGDDVALLCQGDPFFYGSFIQLWTRLAPLYWVEVIPGVCSLVACAAAAATPLVAHDETLTVVPAILDYSELAERLAKVDAAAIVKLGRHFPKVRRVLDALGLLDRACYIEGATLANQRVAPLASVNAASVPYFSMALVRRGPTEPTRVRRFTHDLRVKR